MKFKLKYFFVIAIIFLTIISATLIKRDSSVKYELLDTHYFLKNSEIVKNNIDKYGVSNKPIITSVFTYYNVAVIYDSQRRMLIPSKKINDKTFVRNVIIKSFDKEWLNRHIFLSPDSVQYHR